MIEALSGGIHVSIAAPVAANAIAAPEKSAVKPSDSVSEGLSKRQAEPTDNHVGLGQLSKDIVTSLQGEDASEQVRTNENGEEVNAAGLTDAEQEVVENLKERDREVRNHEQAHAVVGGAYAGSPTYTYETGPDGQRYAVGGEVKIDVAPIQGDPEATIDKMETVIRAALAPAEPSAQDRAVAATASKQKLEAQAELNAQKAAEISGEEPEATQTIPGSPEAAAPIINLFA